MSSKTIIPEIEIKIGDNLYIQIKDISFIPAKKGVYDALPENCYPDEPAEADWLKENAKLVIKKKKVTNFSQVLEGAKGITKEYEYEYIVEDDFFCEYYDQIIKAIEEMEE